MIWQTKGEFLRILACTWININHSNIIINTCSRLNSFTLSHAKWNDAKFSNLEKLSWPRRKDRMCHISKYLDFKELNRIGKLRLCKPAYIVHWKSVRAKSCDAEWELKKKKICITHMFECYFLAHLTIVACISPHCAHIFWVMQVTAGMHNIRAFKAKKTTKLQHKDEEGAGSLVPAPQTDKLLYRFFLFFS